MLARFAPLLPRKEGGLLAVLSTKAERIGDNQLGGFYAHTGNKLRW